LGLGWRDAHTSWHHASRTHDTCATTNMGDGQRTRGGGASVHRASAATHHTGSAHQTACAASQHRLRCFPVSQHTSPAAHRASCASSAHRATRGGHGAGTGRHDAAGTRRQPRSSSAHWARTHHTASAHRPASAAPHHTSSAAHWACTATPCTARSQGHHGHCLHGVDRGRASTQPTSRKTGRHGPVWPTTHTTKPASHSAARKVTKTSTSAREVATSTTT